ncbi:MAG: DoxX family protein [Methylophilaceae bacterium]|nr:MAG: DoxX family protein [Methylophilaceae bacterium]
MQKYQIAAARILLAMVFLGLVLLRLTAIMNNPDGYLQYQITLGQFGLPTIFAPILILIQLVAGIGLLVGLKTILCARVLACLAVFLALVLGTKIPEVFFLYMGIAGGMLLLSVHPQTPFSLDNLKNKA